MRESIVLSKVTTKHHPIINYNYVTQLDCSLGWEFQLCALLWNFFTYLPELFPL